MSSRWQDICAAAPGGCVRAECALSLAALNAMEHRAGVDVVIVPPTLAAIEASPMPDGCVDWRVARVGVTAGGILHIVTV